jgi:hypothetical protein
MENHSSKDISFKDIWNEKEQRNLINISHLWGKMILIKGLIISLN